MTNSKTIIFITGAFVSHNIWDNWQTFFKEKGYKTLAPAWPFKDAAAAVLRSQPNDNELARLRLNELIDYYSDIISVLDEKPIVIGHSLGGLIAQMLADRDIVSVAVAVHSVPPKGVFSFEWRFLKTIIKPLGYFSSAKKTYLMSLNEWKQNFTNGQDATDQLTSYESFCIPESKQVVRDALSKMAAVDFAKAYRPYMLIITGTADNLVPNSLVYENYIRYNKDHSVVNYKEFKNTNHFAIGSNAWAEYADYIHSWLELLEQ